MVVSELKTGIFSNYRDRAYREQFKDFSINESGKEQDSVSKVNDLIRCGKFFSFVCDNRLQTAKDEIMAIKDINLRAEVYEKLISDEIHMKLPDFMNICQDLLIDKIKVLRLTEPIKMAPLLFG